MAFATGGIAPGGYSLVGEQGPELVNLAGGSRIFNRSSTINMLGGGGGTSGKVIFDIERDKLVGILQQGNNIKSTFG